MTETQKAFKESESWIRLAVCVNVHIKKALLGILHNHINHSGFGIPSNPEELYSFLSENKNKFKQLRFLSNDQISILYPQNRYVDTSKFDITLVRFLIQKFCRIKNAQHNWKEPDYSDQTIAAFVYRAAVMRNKIFHCNNIQALEKTEFEELWSQIKDVLKGLKYDVDVEPMKTEDLDYERCHQVLKEEFLIYLGNYKKECDNEDFHDNYIERLFYDVKKGMNISDLKPILENNDGIIIYAKAGMGKSMCARYIRHMWSKDQFLDGYKMISFNSKLINQHLKIQSNAAPIWFSEMGTYLKANGKNIDDFIKYDCVKEKINNLFVVIDGIDEFSIKTLATDDYLQILEKKIFNNEVISAIDTIVGIYFGYFFPNSKICLFGRTCEFERLNKFKDQKCSSVFDKKNRKDLKLLEFDNTNVDQFTCREVCKKRCDGSCREISIKVKKCELCRVPADLKSLIQMYQKSPEKDIGIITRTKLFIAILFNRLNEHTKQQTKTERTRFLELQESPRNCKLIECIRVISHISFDSFLNGNVTISVKEEMKNGVSFFKYNDDIYIEREMLEQLDFFYINNLNYSNYILEPYHLTKMEFLAACFVFSHNKEHLLRLNGERFISVISYVAGLHAKDNPFILDFVTSVLNFREYQIDLFFDWLYGIENIHNMLPNGGVSWYGLQYNQRLTPSVHVLDSIHREHKIPDTFIPTTIVNYCRGRFEWAQLHSLKDILLGAEKEYDDIKFLIKGFLKFDSDKEMLSMKCAFGEKRTTFKINVIDVGIDIFRDSNIKLKYFNFDLSSNSLRIDSTQWSPTDFPSTRTFTTTSERSCIKMKRKTLPSLKKSQPLTNTSENSSIKMEGKTLPSLKKSQPLTNTSEDSSIKMEGKALPSLTKSQSLTNTSENSSIKMEEKTLPSLMKSQSLTNTSENSSIKMEEKTLPSLMKSQSLTNTSESSSIKMKGKKLPSLMKTRFFSTTSFFSRFKMKRKNSLRSMKTGPLTTIPEFSRTKMKRNTSPRLSKGKHFARASLKIRSVNTTSANFKQITINDIKKFSDRFFDDLFMYCICTVDLLSLSHNFFSVEQLRVISKLEKNKKQVCLQFNNIEFKNVFELPSLCTRQISIRNTKFVHDEDLMKLEEQIKIGSKQLPIDSINKYKIIKSTVPFIQKNKIRINHDGTFRLHLHRVNFSNTSPEQFAFTMCSIPSLEIFDDNENLIPHSHWEALAQVKYSHTNELRVWLQDERTRKEKNLKHFLCMKLRRLQLICRKKEGIKHVLNFMKESPLMTKERLIKVFIVRVDLDDWDDYDEKVLLSRMPLRTFFDDYLRNISLLDDKEYESYFEGELKWNRWCCELSKATKRDSLCMQEFLKETEKGTIKEVFV